MTIFIEITNRKSWYTARLYKNGPYRLISIFLCMSAAFLEPFSWGVVFSFRSQTGPLSDFQLLPVRPLHWTSKFEKIKQSVRNWWIGETVWRVKQNKVCQIDVTHKLEGIFLNLPKGKDKTSKYGTYYFFSVHNICDYTFLTYNLKGVFFLFNDLKE